MARPRKNNANWFKHYNNLRNNELLITLRERLGMEGFGIYICFLEYLTGKDFYRLETNDVNIEIAAANFRIKQESLQSVIDYCLKLGILEFCQINNIKYITSPMLNEQFKELDEYRYKDRQKKQKSKIFPRENEVFPKGNEVFPKENEVIPNTIEKVFPKENEVFPKENEVFPKENPEETPERIRDIDISLRSISPSTPTTTARAREKEPDVKESEDIPMTAREGIELLKKDRDWLLQIQRKFGLDAGTLVRWLDSFSVDCDCRGKQEHESLADVKQHFNNWMSKQNLKRNGGKKGADDDFPPLTSLQRWNKCHAELCQAVSPEECSQSFDVIRFERFEVSTSKLFILVPNKETYEYMEHHLVDVMSRIIPKYFGSNFQLQYHLP